MNNKTIFLRPILLIAICLIFLSNSYAGIDRLPVPKIQAGTAKISGTIQNLKLPEGEKNVSVEIWVGNPLTGDESKFSTKLNENNRFSIEVPLECSAEIVGLNVSTETKVYGNVCIGLVQWKEVQINIVYDSGGKIKVDATGGLNLSSDDIHNIGNAIVIFDEHFTWGDYYKMTPKEFADHELNIGLKERTKAVMDSLVLSEKIKNYLIDGFNIHFLKGRLFFYKEDAEKSFKMSETESPFYTNFTAVEPDKSYYSFLKGFNLNNPQYLYSFTYSDFLQKFLAIAAFKIPKIKDTPIDEWLKGVKNTVQEVVGFNSGFFYDMLAAKAYAIQLNDQKVPLTAKQVQNIATYFKGENAGYSKILIKKNEELVKSIAINNDLKVNDTPAVSKEKVIDAIVARYKGSVVLVDFWATWCSPCMNAHKEMKPFKDKIKGKGVVFVYLTTTSSPKPLWEGKIKGIGGEQYYLAENEWDYILDSFKFTGIPSYLIYDKNGVLKQQFTGYPGTEKMKGMVEALLR